MVKFQIVIHSPHKSIIKVLKENPKIINREIYDILDRYGIDEETKIDCASWCELAIYDDSYNTDEFDIYVSEE